MSEKRLLWLILLLFVALGTAYALVTPVFEASDELWHYPMVQHLADGNPLPVQAFDPAEAGPWKQEASQPPLYYWLGAALTFWIDTSDMAVIRRLNPHVDNGVLTKDGNINLAVHDPASDPMRGTLLAVRVVRLASVLMGLVTVYMTYRLGKYAAPGRPEIALGAAAFIAFTPMFLFISGAVNNDNPAIMLAAVALVLIVYLVRRPATRGRDEVGLTLLLGAVIGLGLLTKEGTLALLPLAGGALFMRQWVLARDGQSAGQYPLTLRRLLRLLGTSLVLFGLLCVPVLLIAGWWYYRNVVLYGDWLGWNAFIAVLGQRPQPASLAQLWDERHGFLMSYWGLFGGVNVPMWQPVYALLNGLLVVAIGGFAVYLLQQARRWRLAPLRPAGAFVARVLDLVEQMFPLVVCLLFSAAVTYGLITWATITWSSQGRLVFTALPALTVLLLLGLVGWMPGRPARLITGGLAVMMFVLAAVAPLLWIRPAYQPESYAPPQPERLVDAAEEFGGLMRLTGYAVEPAAGGGEAFQPGDAMTVILNWEVLQAMDRDWSVFVHLNDPVLNTPIAQRDMYHGQGLRPTSLLAPGEKLTTYYVLTVPEATITPSQLDLLAGLYDYESGERLPLTNGDDALRLTTLNVESASAEFPNALAVNLGNAIELVGFEVEPRVTGPGDTVLLTLYWRPGAQADRDYTFFAQILDDDTTRWAFADVAPVPGTGSAAPGEVQVLQLPLSLRADTPADVYPLIVGAYTQDAEGDFNRLQIVDEGRITMADFVTLTRVRVAGE